MRMHKHDEAYYIIVYTLESTYRLFNWNTGHWSTGTIKISEKLEAFPKFNQLLNSYKRLTIRFEPSLKSSTFSACKIYYFVANKLYIRIR